MKYSWFLLLFPVIVFGQYTPPGGGGGGGSGTVTSVTIAGTANKISVSGTCTITTSGTCTATIPDGVVLVAPVLGTPASGTLTNATGLPAAAVVAGALANGMTATTQSASDNSTKLATTAYADAVGTASKAFSALTSGTNTGAAMVVGTGASIAATGSGAITATAAPVGGITGLGTGVGAALAINVGSAGAPVLFGGAGGTPSSLTLTNATGLPVAGLSNLGTGVGTWLATPSSANLASAMTDESGTGALIFADSPAFTTLATLTNNLAANTSGDGYQLVNSTAATSGNQRYSPRLHFTGQGWKTTATAASQTVDWIAENQPVQGTANPSTLLSFSSSVNGSGYTLRGGLSSNNAAATPELFVGYSNTGFWNPAANILNVSVNGADSAVFLDSPPGINFPSGGRVGFSSSSASYNAPDVSFDRDAAGIIGIINNTVGTTAANYRALKLSALYHGGTTFTAANCGAGSLTGGATAGTITTTTGACTTLTVTMGNSATAATGWSCHVNDQTTATNLWVQASSTTTTAVFKGTSAANDVLNFSCDGY